MNVKTVRMPTDLWIYIFVQYNKTVLQ